jgi:RNA polymerase sigma-70 factor, ECF subfamily
MVEAAAIADVRLGTLWMGARSLGESPTAEAAWARDAARGDKPAFARLVDLHKRTVYGLCVGLLRDPEEARDAAQEAFTRAWAALRTYDPGQPFGPWVLRIARNHCLDVLRRRLPDPQRVELDARPAGGPRPELSDPSAVAADDVLERRERQAFLDGAVAALPRNYREVVHLFHVEHLSYKEIAATLDVPIGTVMTWLHRARARLKEALTTGRTEIVP